MEKKGMNNKLNSKINSSNPAFDKITKMFNVSKLEKELEQSNYYLSIALKGTSFGRWSWDINSDEITLSPELLELLGFKNIKIVLDKKSYFGKIHPDDRIKFINEIKKHKQGAIDIINIDIRMKTAYDEWNWINLRCKITEYDKKGSPCRLDGLNYDINEQKQYDEEVQRLQNEIIEAKDNENEMQLASVAHVSKNLDWYSSFRLNSLNSLL